MEGGHISYLQVRSDECVKNGNLDFSLPIFSSTKHTNQIRLHSISLWNVFYNINSDNNSLTFTYNNVTTTVSVDEGQYTIADLLLQLDTLVGATVPLEFDTQKFQKKVLVRATANFVTSLVIEKTSMGKILGVLDTFQTGLLLNAQEAIFPTIYNVGLPPLEIYSSLLTKHSNDLITPDLVSRKTFSELGGVFGEEMIVNINYFYKKHSLEVRPIDIYFRYYGNKKIPVTYNDEQFPITFNFILYQSVKTFEI